MSTEHVESVISSLVAQTEQEEQSGQLKEEGRRQKTRWNVQDALYLLFLVLLVASMALRYAPNLVSAVPGMWWDPLLNIWTLSWDTTTLLHAPTHLWQAPLLYPNNLTLSYSENLLGEAILFAPFFLITHNPVFAYNMVFYLTFLLCGINMYILARHYTGKPLAAFIAALIYAFAPYRIGQIDHIHVVAGEWMPLAFLYLHLSLKEQRWRHWSLFALFYLLQLLSSIYYGIFLSYTLLAYVLIRYSRPFWSRWRASGKRYLLELSAYALQPAIVFGVVLVILGVLMTPYFLSLSSGLSRGLDQTESYSAFIRDFGFTAPYNWLYGSNYYNGVPVPNDSEHHLFLGWVTMALAALGIVLAARRRNITMRCCAWTALVVLIFAFGPALQYATDSGAPYIPSPPMPPFTQPYPPGWPMPWLLAYYVLPGFKGLRVPARLVGVLLMLLALLAAYGVAWLQEIDIAKRLADMRMPRRFTIRAPVGAVVLRCLLLLLPLGLLLESYAGSFPVTQVPVGNAIPPVYQWLATHGGDQPIVELPMAYLDVNISSKAEAWYDYYSIYHGHPIVNGWSGYRPPLTTEIAGWMLSFPSPQSVALLRYYHIRYVVVHAQLYQAPTIAPQFTEMEASPYLHLVAVFGNDSVWQVDPL